MSMLDFAALPPEINSGRMYAGAGSGPMITAAAAWDGLASELTSAATSYQSVLSELTAGSWQGPSSTSMTAAAAPYVGWMDATAAQAQQTASQARSAVAAYEAAFAATVPPPVIAANRSLLASLVATNILGQNTPAIAATETEYGEMWAQDAAAMYGYAGTSAAAAQLTSFSPAPQTTNPTATTNQAATTSQSAAASQAAGTGSLTQDLLNFLNGPLVQDFETLNNLSAGYLGGLSGGAFVVSGAGFVISPFVSAALLPATAAAQALVAAPAAVAPAVATSDVAGGALGSTLAGSSASGARALGSAGLGEAEVSAGLGRAASIGGLSVPQAWGTAAPEIRLAAKASPMAGLDGLPDAAAAGPSGSYGGGMPAVGPIGSVVNAPRNGEPDSRTRFGAKIVGQTGEKRDGRDDTRPRWANFDGFAPDGHAPQSERDELDALRKSIAALAKERDVLKRSAALLIKEATQR